VTWPYCPVKIDARAGVQMALVLKHLLSLTPSEAMRSMLGVRNTGDSSEPYALMALEA